MNVRSNFGTRATAWLVAAIPLAAAAPLIAVLALAAIQPAAADAGAAVAETKASQAALTPADAKARLIAGNDRFVKGELKSRDLMAQVEATASGQYPFAVVLGCIDSRVPPELVFDQGIGDIFSARVAGNFVNSDILGSMEFATAVAGSKLIVVLGHSACGAVKGACDGVELGHLTHTLSNIAPAVYATDVEGERSSKNTAFVDAVTRKNVELTVANITERSAVIRDLVAEGKVEVVGAVHDVASGKVTFF